MIGSIDNADCEIPLRCRHFSQLLTKVRLSNTNAAAGAVHVNPQYIIMLHLKELSAPIMFTRGFKQTYFPFVVNVHYTLICDVLPVLKISLCGSCFVKNCRDQLEAGFRVVGSVSLAPGQSPVEFDPKPNLLLASDSCLYLMKRSGYYRTSSWRLTAQSAASAFKASKAFLAFPVKGVL